MTILPGLTSTAKSLIPVFVEDLARSKRRRIALFPTCLEREERLALYRELAKIRGLVVPHVHLRSDCGLDEIAYLQSALSTEVFNVHPRASSHPFQIPLGSLAERVFVENVEKTVDDSELEGPGAMGGICPDFSHLENARLQGRSRYVDATLSQLQRYPVGCCHLSAIRIGVPNTWAGEWDHHAFSELGDFDYLAAYRAFMPKKWASLELENSLAEQLEAIRYIEPLIVRR